MQILDDNERFELFFDEGEREAIETVTRERNGDKNDTYETESFFSEDWIEAFTPQEYDNQNKRENKGLVGRFLFGGDYGHG